METEKFTLSRRSFLKLGAAIGGSAVLAGPLGLEFGKISGSDTAYAATGDEYTVIPTCGRNNCGGRCVIKAYVKDGTVVKLGTDDDTPDTFEQPQIRACIRGRGYRKTFLRDDRLKYPMKRVGARGEGKFERISWEEAIDTIVSETKRITEKYGPASRYVNYGSGINSSLRGDRFARSLLALDGGHLNFYGSYSSGQLNYVLPYVYGSGTTSNGQRDWVNSKLIILWGHNPAETIFGPHTNYYLRKAKEAGARIISIDPRYNDSAISVADEYVPILPSTDGALAAGMAYVMITENLHDKAFLDKYCIGFDKDHMPEGYEKEESYEEYILGTRDGIPKTPEWASSICKAPVEQIYSLAREYATTKPANLFMGYGPQRHANGEYSSWATALLACMTGNVGISGGGGGGGGGAFYRNTPVFPTGDNPVKATISCFLWTDAITRGTDMTKEKDAIQGVDRLTANIKMIWNLQGNTLINQHSDINKTMEILKDESLVEFILCSDLFMTPSTKFADILLPGASMFEDVNIGIPWGHGEFLLCNNKAIDPLFESKTDYDWIKEVARKLGHYDEFTQGNETAWDWARTVYNRLRDGNEPDLPPFDDFAKAGQFKYPPKAPSIAFKKNIEDLDNNPFNTPSGRIELFSARLFDRKEADVPGIPKYVPAFEGPQDTNEEYPLQVLGSHTRRRCHSTHDNNVWMEEAKPQVMWINPIDAEERGIKTGDRVEVYNERGRVHITAHVTPRTMPGVVDISQGAWVDFDRNGVDQRGSINVLTTHVPSPMSKSNPQHTNICQVKKL